VESFIDLSPSDEEVEVLSPYPSTSSDSFDHEVNQATSDKDSDGEKLPHGKSEAVLTVVVKVEWFEDGDKVYITGTMFDRSRKMELFPE